MAFKTAQFTRDVSAPCAWQIGRPYRWRYGAPVV